MIPVNFLWTGDELAIGAFAGTYKVRDLRSRPDVAICIDTTDSPHRCSCSAGRSRWPRLRAYSPEYATTQRQVMGDEAGNAYLEAIDKPGLRMVRIGLRPTWVGVLDFQERFARRTPEPVLAAFGADR